jgi:hypothetical protein
MIKQFWSYIVYDSGKVYNKFGKELKAAEEPNTGYLKIYLYDTNCVRHMFYLHRLIALLFVPNPDNLPEVNHKDKVKLNCASCNLEWCNHQYNMEHAKARAVQQLSKEGVLLQTFVSLSEAARCMNKPKQTGNLHKVCNGERQTWLGYKWRYENEAVD